MPNLDCFVLILQESNSLLLLGRVLLVRVPTRFQHQKPDNTNSFELDKETEKLTSQTWAYQVFLLVI
jgi:hypothetical protein